jgi:type II pantothenate kinase
VIQRPLNENRNDEGDISHTTSPTTSESSGDGSDSKGRQPEANTFRGPVLAPSGSSWLGESEDLYPYLVVNIGSGVSMLRVDDADKFQRVGGTSLGGSTFLGLASALTGCTSFEEAINYAMEGDSTQIDMLVGDIYGGDYTEMGLAATTVASSFGKLVQPGRCEAAMKSPQHLAKAVLLMVTNNIGSIAMLHAQAAGVRHVMFTGSFLHENKLAMRLLAVAMDFWSKGNIKAVFLRHEGHAGAMGALLNTLDPVNQIDSLLLNGS